jgi:capsular exopolysaccharide synthesis family protein
VNRLLTVSQSNLTGRRLRRTITPRVIVEDAGPSPLLEYWCVLRRRKGSLFLIAFACLLCSLVWTFQQTPVYQARTVLEIQNLNENFLNMRDVSPTASQGAVDAAETDLQTQVNILQSQSVLRSVISKPDLAARLSASDSTGVFARWSKLLHSAQTQAALSEDALLRQLTNNLHVVPRADTRLVDVLYESTDPNLAADVANALTAEYGRQNLQSRWQAAEKTGEWLTQQMEEIRTKLERSERQLQAYANSAGLIFTDEKDNIAEAKLRQLQDELSKAQAERVASQSRYELASTASAESVPEVLDDSTLKEYRVKLTDLRRQLAELTASLTAAHPSVKRVTAQVAALEAAQEKARGDVIRRIQNEFQSAQRRETLLTRGYNAQARLVTEQSATVAHYNILKREVDNNRQLYASMLQHVKEAAIASTLHASNVRIIDTATPPRKPYKPSLPLNTAVGLLAGCLLGVGFVLVRERTDRSIQAPGEVSLHLDLPELGVIPSVNAERHRAFAYHAGTRMIAESWRGSDTPQKTPVELITWHKRPSVIAEAFHSTVTSILYAGEKSNRPRVIAVTSANPQEGKTTVASNLALAFAEIGRRVLLIDGDLHRPRLHEVFGVPNGLGLTDVLEKRETHERCDTAVVATGYPNLFLLTAGSVPSSVSSLLHSPQTTDFLKLVRQEFDMVLIDTPPMLQIPDARVLGQLADGAILVVRSARTTKEDATSAGQRLAADGTRVLGTILNEWDPRNSSHPGYEYGYRQYGSPQAGRS